jgi:hypothetical protein
MFKDKIVMLEQNLARIKELSEGVGEPCVPDRRKPTETVCRVMIGALIGLINWFAARYPSRRMDRATKKYHDAVDRASTDPEAK